MFRTSSRRLFTGFVATAVLTVVTIVGGASPAHAAASGTLLVKGTGSVYTDSNGVNLGIIPGQGTKSFSFKVLNTGSQNQQFKVTVQTLGSGFTASLFSGYKAVTSPFTTSVIQPGKSTVLTLKIAVFAGQPQDEYIAVVNLLDPLTDQVLDSSFADANATYQTGTTQHDLFLKTGSQPFVGGSVSQFLTASTLKVGNTATYTLRLKNNGNAPANIGVHGLDGFQCPDNFILNVKQGYLNVTGAVLDGVYTTGTLNPGAKKELKVTIKLLSDDDSCTSEYFYFEATGPDGSIGSAAHVVIAA